MIKYNLNLSIDQLVGLHYEPKKIKYNFSKLEVKKIEPNIVNQRSDTLQNISIIEILK